MDIESAKLIAAAHIIASALNWVGWTIIWAALIRAACNK